jgi:hypothetical protein
MVLEIKKASNGPEQLQRISIVLFRSLVTELMVIKKPKGSLFLDSRWIMKAIKQL